MMEAHLSAAVDAALEEGAEDVVVLAYGRRARVFTRSQRGLEVRSKNAANVRVRALVGGRVGFASSTDTSFSSLEALGVAAAQAACAASLMREGTERSDAFPARSATWRPPTVEGEVRALEEVLAVLEQGFLWLEERLGGLASVTLTLGVEEASERVATSTGLDLDHAWPCFVFEVRGHLNQKKEVMRAYRWEGQHGVEGFTYEGIQGGLEELADALLGVKDAAPPAPGRYPLVLGPEVMAVLVHEGFGHLLEEERDETPVGTRIASGKVSVFADSALEGGIASFGVDLFGVEAGRCALVVDGKVQGSVRGGGIGLARLDRDTLRPIRPLPNLEMVPGSHAFASLLQEAEGGLYLGDVARWWLDEHGRSLILEAPYGRRISAGALEEVVLSPVVRADLYELWRACHQVGEEATQLGIVLGCEAEEGGRRAATVLVPAARFSEVEISSWEAAFVGA